MGDQKKDRPADTEAPNSSVRLDCPKENDRFDSSSRRKASPLKGRI